MRHNWKALRDLYVRADELTLETLAAGAERELGAGTGVLSAARHSSEEWYHHSDAGRLGRGIQEGVGGRCCCQDRRAGGTS